ncbi:hypothetical protein EYC59_04945 [Candidatus Saccharibacteria bacterium]|nr:MAG: hypothetical protein EYC59_04945 [Candidatus Saccharibacteria bacterium]
MENNTPQPVSGQLLVAHFQTAFIALVTAIAAKSEAERSENNLVGQLRYMSGGAFLSPGQLNPDFQTDVTRSSLDAHIKKVQAEQLDVASSQQVEALLEQDKHDYVGRRVRVDVINPNETPIDSVWFNQHHGYRHNNTKRKLANGTIREVRLDENVLLIQPPFTTRLLYRELKYYAVYIINPETLEPMVTLTVN